MKIIARIVVVLLALAGYYLAPLVAAAKLLGGENSRAQALAAGEKADEMMAVLVTRGHEWLSQGAANNKTGLWPALAWLLDTGWPGHLEQYRG